MKMSIAAVGVVACMAMSVATSYANSVGGRVTCAETGAPVPGVKVVIQTANVCDLFPSSGVQITDANGEYIFYLGDCELPWQLCLDTTTLPPGSTLNGNACVDLTMDTSQTINFSVNCQPSQCTGQIGDFVWQDTNGNGCQDAGEPGIPGVQVNLYSGACGSAGALVATTTTDATGHYLFSGLCAGDYQVAITTPAGYSATTANVGCKDTTQPPYTQDRDSKCSCAGASPCITCVTLTAANPVNLNVDCGYSQCNGQIGDFVWNDLNGNGCQDAGEPGISGVQVSLYSGACGSAGTLVTTVTTDSTGHYLFSGLCPGAYQVAITTPSGGYTATTPNVGCKDNSQPPYTADRDSKCNCAGASPCITCVTLTAANPVNLNVDCGYTQSGPSLQLLKTADNALLSPGEVPTYNYVVKNTGNVTVSGINIVDDNGTPGDTSDDFIVNPAPFSLAPAGQPGDTATYSITHITEPLCMTINGLPTPVATLTVNVDPNGDVEVWFIQSQSVNDNRYGTGATSATGWSSGHKFSDLTGSDMATFQFTDGNDNVVLKFKADYISAATSTKFGDGVPITYPSGYGTLGPLGGDGGMLVGSAASVLSVHTTFSDTINQPAFTSGFTVNSPPETSPLSNVSIPAGWNYTDGYYVKVSGSAFGAAGFKGVTLPLVHNSPSKKGFNAYNPTNMCACVHNIAVVSGVTAGGVTVSDTDDETVCAAPSGGGGGGVCSLLMGAVKFDKNTIQIPIKDTGSANVVMSELKLTWPQATNGKLKTVTLNGTAFNGPAVGSPVDLTTANWTGTTGSRTINKGQSKTLVLTFEHNVDKTASHYSGGVAIFGTDASCQVKFLP